MAINTKSIYGDSEESNVSSGNIQLVPSLIAIDSDDRNITVSGIISKIRESISITPKGETIVIVVTTGLLTCSLNWKTVFLYLSDMSTEHGVNFEICFRGILTIDMLNIFQYEIINVSISEKISIAATNKSLLKFVFDNPEKINIISKYFGTFVNSDASVYVIDVGFNVVNDLGYKFEIF